MLVQERAGNTLEAIGISNDFLSRTQMAQQLRERFDKWDFMKVKNGHQIERLSPNRRKSLPAIHLTRDQ
jgi:hypothetical protein